MKINRRNFLVFALLTLALPLVLNKIKIMDERNTYTFLKNEYLVRELNKISVSLKILCFVSIVIYFFSGNEDLSDHQLLTKLWQLNQMEISQNKIVNLSGFKLGFTLTGLLIIIG